MIQEFSITKAQADILRSKLALVQSAQLAYNIACAAVAAGHNVTTGDVVGFTDTTLQIQFPDPVDPVPVVRDDRGEGPE